jgi:hypothetical protein
LQSRYETLEALESVDDRLACAVSDGATVALGEDRSVSCSARVPKVDQGFKVRPGFRMLFVARMWIVSF